jgi:hypothetical protein
MRNGRSSAALLFALTAPPLTAQVTITSAPGGFSLNTSVGPATFAQSFRTPDATNVLLEQFQFHVGSAQPNVPYAARIFAFNSTTATTGALLAERMFPGGPATSGAVLIPFDFNLLLTPGADYLFALSYSNAAGVVVRTLLGGVGSPYTGGDPYVAAQSGPLVLVQVATGRVEDFAFTATFQPAIVSVPEPATWALLAAGLSVIGGVVLRRVNGRKPSA